MIDSWRLLNQDKHYYCRSNFEGHAHCEAMERHSNLNKSKDGERGAFNASGNLSKKSLGLSQTMKSSKSREKKHSNYGSKKSKLIREMEKENENNLSEYEFEENDSSHKHLPITR